MESLESAEQVAPPVQSGAPDEQSGIPASKSYAERAEANLRDAVRFVKRDGGGPTEQRVMLQLQAANVLALLELADAIRSHGASHDGSER